MGTLTKRGYLQEVANGKSLRSAYVDGNVQKFLPSQWEASAVQVNSDDEERTLHSAQAMVSGLYPTRKEDAKLEEITIHTQGIWSGFMTPNKHTCPMWGHYITKMRDSPVYRKHLLSITKPLAEKVEKATGMKFKGHLDPLFSHVMHEEGRAAEAARHGFIKSKTLHKLHDCINAHLCHGFPIPDTLTPELRGEVDAEVTWQSYQQYLQPDRQKNARMGIGFLIRQVRECQAITCYGGM